MAVSAFISTDDGYTEKAYIKEAYNVHPAVRIRFRPLPVTDRAQSIESVRDKSRGRDQEIAVADVMSRRIVSWDFLDENGNSIEGVPEVSRQSLLRLKAPLFVRLASIVYHGYEGGDIDPLDDETPENPLKRLEADQKN